VRVAGYGSQRAFCYTLVMNSQELKQAVQQLPEKEFKAFEEWFDNFRAEVWNKQIKADVQSGKLNKMAEQALADFRKGKFTKF
jgi:hypothetical protein